jgi:glyoxylase-like metal-dependent hydrolase (beta-lactamase superfamily II)
MKSHASCFFIGLFLATCTGIHAQWYKVKELSDNVWVLDDHGSDNSYLVIGTDSALLIDTGLGLADLKSVVKKITDKPVIVVNTHGHPDHVGANYQFEKAYIHPADSASARSFLTPSARERTAGMMTRGEGPAPGETYTGEIFTTRVIPVKEGDVFNLGGRQIEVMETPGHTPGEICLLDREHKLLFTGDNNNSLVWLFLENCLPLSEYLVTLKKQESRLEEFDTLFPGHGPPMRSDFILDQIQCVSSILDGTCESEPYESFAGNAMICTWGRAKVTFNPDNL